MPKPALQRCLESLSRFSLHSQYRLGDLLALFVAVIPNQVARQTRQNIELCFGDFSPVAKRRLYRESIRHTCYAMTELAAAWCWPPERLLACITEVDICDEFEASGRGKIVIVPHLGSWETMVIWLGRYCNAIIMYKRRRNRSVDAFVRDARARSGGNPLPTKKRGLRQLLLGMRKGASLMILPDQRPGGNKAYIESTFFGHSAPTSTLVYNLCTKIDCDVFIGAICRSNPVGQFSLRIRPLDHDRLAADEVGSAQYMNDRIESLVRDNLAQYQWGYRRFGREAYASLNGEGR